MSIVAALSVGLLLAGTEVSAGDEGQPESSKMPFFMDDTVFEELMTTFRRRNIRDWARHWRMERHRRCTIQLHQHMDLVCSVYDMRFFEKRGSNEDSSAHRRLPSFQSEVDRDPNADPSFESFDDVSGGELKVWDSNDVGATDRSQPNWLQLRRRRMLTVECCYREEGCKWADFAAFCDTPPHRKHPLLA